MEGINFVSSKEMVIRNVSTDAKFDKQHRGNVLIIFNLNNVERIISVLVFEGTLNFVEKDVK